MKSSRIHKKYSGADGRTVPHKKKAIKYEADFQLDWESLIQELPIRQYKMEGVDELSQPGDAPKDFIFDREYREGHRSRTQRFEGYIAKVGSKFYPNESITEQLITRIGQIYKLNIADSKLRMVNGQVRFMSKYFLKARSEQLTHGAEIYEASIGKDNYSEIRDQKIESEYFTFQMTLEAIQVAFLDHSDKIMQGYVEMLTFDALIGHNDRHPYNWGVIVPIKKSGKPRFSPVYDTARALFWNVPEGRIQQMLKDRLQFETYLQKCEPPIGWDGQSEVDFFRLIGLIWLHYGQFRRNIEKFLLKSPLDNSDIMIDAEFSKLMSPDRRNLIKRCLLQRRQRLCQAVDEVKSHEIQKKEE